MLGVQRIAWKADQNAIQKAIDHAVVSLTGY